MSSLKNMILCLACVLSLPGAALAEETFAEHQARAQILASNDQYAEALKELTAAYTLRQSPKLLPEMAKMHRKLGNAREALSCYRRFLVAEADIDLALRAEVELQIAELQALTADPAPALPAPTLPARAPLHWRSSARTSERTAGR